MAYTTTALVKEYLGIAADATADDTLIGRLVQAAQGAIDDHCRRRFEAITTTRYYRRSDRAQGRLLFLDDDLLTISALTNGDDTVIPSGGYWLEPRNEPPYGMIRLKSSYIWNWNTDGEIRVLGQWGFSLVAPADVAHAATRWAAYMYRQKDSTVFDVTADPQAGIITTPQGMPRDVKVLLESYRRSTVAGGMT